MCVHGVEVVRASGCVPTRVGEVSLIAVAADHVDLAHELGALTDERRAAERLGELAREFDFKRTLIVSDKGLLPAGFVDRAKTILSRAGIWSCSFHDFEPNPDSEMVEAGRRYAAAQNIDSIVALGGGSSLDCAKGINFVLTNGGAMTDYRGYGKASTPLLPMIGIPTTAGTRGTPRRCSSASASRVSSTFTGSNSTPQDARSSFVLAQEDQPGR